MNCQLWPRGRDSSGYGMCKFRGKPERAHRMVWRMFFGEIPEGMLVRHKCDVRLCVNPEHLELGTIQDNIKDREDRGRGSKGVNRPGAKLDPEKVKIIRSSTKSRKDLATEFGVTTKTIEAVLKLRKWRNV